jgi:hypothetical protein
LRDPRGWRLKEAYLLISDTFDWCLH